eukprot:m.138198 g.138198  ORF g.138198 m.138198 type:complete len:205 (+) comp13611_c0_seq1:102-716(+)
MVRKGLSFEEKRSRMLEWFYDKEDVFSLKNVEKYCSKEKGITSMSIKDVLQSLVDDNMVKMEKIGTSNYYWAFLSEGASVRQNRQLDLEASLKSLAEEKEALDAKIEEAQSTRQESEERTRILAELEEEEKKQEEFDIELQQFKDSDPELLEKKESDTKIAKEAANRWTDNVFAIKSWCQRKFNIDPNTMDKQFGIPTDFDSIE